MENKEIAQEIYSKINLEIKKKKKSQKVIAKEIGMTPQTFSDNMNRLIEGKFPKVEFLLEIQRVLKVNLGINFFKN
jgi:transcriptional regulator